MGLILFYFIDQGYGHSYELNLPFFFIAMIVVYIAFVSPAAFAESNALYGLMQLSNGANNTFSAASYQSENRVFLRRQFEAWVTHILDFKLDASLEPKNKNKHQF